MLTGNLVISDTFICLDRVDMVHLATYLTMREERRPELQIQFSGGGVALIRDPNEVCAIAVATGLANRLQSLLEREGATDRYPPRHSWATGGLAPMTREQRAQIHTSLPL